MDLILSSDSQMLCATPKIKFNSVRVQFATADIFSTLISPCPWNGGYWMMAFQEEEWSPQEGMHRWFKRPFSPLSLNWEIFLDLWNGEIVRRGYDWREERLFLSTFGPLAVEIEEQEEKDLSSQQLHPASENNLRKRNFNEYRVHA